MPPPEKSAYTGSVKHPANMVQSRRSTPIAYLITCSLIWVRSSIWRMRDSRSVVMDGLLGVVARLLIR